MKRFVNLFVFHSYVAAQRGLLSLDDAALVADLDKVLGLSELVVRWPQLADRLAAPADHTPTTLEALTAVAGDKQSWREAMQRLALVPGLDPGAVDSADTTVPLDDLRQFLDRVVDSVPLMAKLV